MTIISTQYASGIVNATEKAAIAASKLIGLGDEKAEDQVAVDAMRTALNDIDFKGRIVIGEGERDDAPMLYIGEEVGSGNNNEVDIALDPLEGTTITAKGMPNSLAVIAAAQKGGLLYAPDTYMNKIAVGGELPKDIVDLDASVKDNIKSIADAKKIKAGDVGSQAVYPLASKVFLIPPCGKLDASGSCCTSDLPSNCSIISPSEEKSKKASCFSAVAPVNG